MMEPISVKNTIPLTWTRAEGFIVNDDHGNQWIDMTSGIFVANAGHSNPEIKKALIDQINSNLIFSYNYPTQIKQQFLEKLLAISPKHFDKVLLLMTGSEACDAAFKLIKLWGKKNQRKYIITFKGSYHGRGLSNDLVSGYPQKASWSGINDENIVFLDFPYTGNELFDETLLPPANQIAAFFIETFQGWGAWFYPKPFISKLCQFARKEGALICFDEMQAGFYRLGEVYGYMTYDEAIQPDLLCLGKGISSSLPIAAVLSRNELVNIDTQADLHGTHSGNPLCCAAALANLEFLSTPKFLHDFRQRVRVFEQRVCELESLPSVKKVNARGMIAGLIFDDANLATEIAFECINRGVLPVCTNRSSIKLAPPLVISEEAIHESIDVLRDSINFICKS
ncbi:MAG: aspartate aminotransferase family protein [Candidatus Riflebacteria bacterium]|nr:aspartate aminotransferase family protein [Candidatus Riflebacteria bacterium]